MISDSKLAELEGIANSKIDFAWTLDKKVILSIMIRLRSAEAALVCRCEEQHPYCEDDCSACQHFEKLKREMK